MGQSSKVSLVPVVREFLDGVAVYHLVNAEGAALSLENWMPNKTQEDTAQGREITPRAARGTTGLVFGVLVFLGGVALLALTFSLAITMFRQDPAQLFNMQSKTLDLSKAAATLMGVVVKILLLLVMAIVGGVIANRGIHMYSESRHAKK